MFILFAASAFRKLSSIYVFSYFPFGFEGRIWDLIVSVPDHCLSFYLEYVVVVVFLLLLLLFFFFFLVLLPTLKPTWSSALISPNCGCSLFKIIFNMALQ